MSLIRVTNVISIVLFHSLSIAEANDPQVQWQKIGEKEYFFNAAPLTQADANAKCRGLKAKLFEPKTEETNREVFVQAGVKLGQLPAGVARTLWIGVSDRITEAVFTYVSDEKPVAFTCKGNSAAPAPSTGCWATATAPVAPTDCVSSSSNADGKWTEVACGGTLGSICERDVKPTAAPPTQKPPTQKPTIPTDSGSTCLESGAAVLLGMLFFCYH